MNISANGKSDGNGGLTIQLDAATMTYVKRGVLAILGLLATAVTTYVRMEVNAAKFQAALSQVAIQTIENHQETVMIKGQNAESFKRLDDRINDEEKKRLKGDKGIE